jgi:hypothetical protein
VQEVAFVTVHWRMEDWPGVEREEGEAPRETTGRGVGVGVGEGVEDEVGLGVGVGPPHWFAGESFQVCMVRRARLFRIFPAASNLSPTFARPSGIKKAGCSFERQLFLFP